MQDVKSQVFAFAAYQEPAIPPQRHLSTEERHCRSTARSRIEDLVPDIGQIELKKGFDHGMQGYDLLFLLED